MIMMSNIFYHSNCLYCCICSYCSSYHRSSKTRSWFLLILLLLWLLFLNNNYLILSLLWVWLLWIWLWIWWLLVRILLIRLLLSHRNWIIRVLLKGSLCCSLRRYCLVNYLRCWTIKITRNICNRLRRILLCIRILRISFCSFKLF
jgi:hypothetical protein